MEKSLQVRQKQGRSYGTSIHIPQPLECLMNNFENSGSLVNL